MKEFGQNPEAVLNRLLNGEEQPPGGDLVRQEKHVINAELLREVCRAGGLPDFVGIRPIVWRVLLGYLPLERDQWDEVLLRARQAYEVFCADAVINSPRSASVAELEQDALYLSICKDVNRTLTMFHFFSSVEQEQDEAMRQDSPQDPQSKNFDLNRRASESKGFVFENRHQQALVRILYIYSKLNPGIGYVQGMNEILAPLYYLFVNDRQEKCIELFPLT